MLETEKEIQNLEFGYSALTVEVKHFWLKTDQPKNLNCWAVLSFPVETWSMMWKTRGREEGKTQFSNRFLPLSSFKGCKKPEVLDSCQVVGATAYEVGEGFCRSSTRKCASCPSFLSLMGGDVLQGMLEGHLLLSLDLMSTRDHARGAGTEDLGFGWRHLQWHLDTSVLCSCSSFGIAAFTCSWAAINQNQVDLQGWNYKREITKMRWFFEWLLF